MGRAFENQQRALAKLALIVPVTIFFIFVLLYTAFNSVWHAALILANVPFATIGGCWRLPSPASTCRCPPAIGFIAVFGVAMLNGIVLVSFLNELREKGLSVRERWCGHGAASAARADVITVWRSSAWCRCSRPVWARRPNVRWQPWSSAACSPRCSR